MLESKTLTKEQVQLVLEIIENLQVYTTDDHYAEMVNDMDNSGQPNWSDDVLRLQAFLAE